MVMGRRPLRAPNDTPTMLTTRTLSAGILQTALETIALKYSMTFLTT